MLFVWKCSTFHRQPRKAIILQIYSITIELCDPCTAGVEYAVTGNMPRLEFLTKIPYKQKLQMKDSLKAI